MIASVFLAAGLLASCFSINALAEDTKARDAVKEFDMHAPYVRGQFADSDMDRTSGSVVLGAISNGGAEAGEVHHTAGNIKTVTSPAGRRNG
ncbi:MULTISPECIES: hypothetical protein [Xanthobacter]|nr:hypothetical protein [Xanthobacter sp. NFM-89]